MSRSKATAAYWTQPRTRDNSSTPPRSTRFNPSEPSRRSTRLQQTLPTNPQSASPLFAVPRELRDYIFKLALTTYEDPTKPYDVEMLAGQQRNSPNCCPSYYHRLRTDTALLRTCRLVHNETALLPVSVNTHTLCYTDLHVFSCPRSTIAASYFKRMTSTQLAAVQYIHIFAKRSCLTAKDPGRYISYSAFAELGSLRGKKWKNTGERRDTCGIGGLYPKKMKITIRNGDWTF